MLIRVLCVAACTVLAAGCPSEVASVPVVAAPSVTKAPEANEADPRVERVGEDLYPAKTIERSEQRSRQPGADGPPADEGAGDDAQAPPTGLGSGRPDETNGKCRLFAPKLPSPECCESHLGFDAAAVTSACEYELYLGESFQASCGFHFQDKAGRTASFRVSRLAEESVAAAVKTHYRQPAMGRAKPAAGMGIEGVMRSRHDGWNWAFIPGWDDSVRLVSWRDGFCSEGGIKTIIEKLVAAKPPAPGAQRPLVPAAAY